MSVDIGGMRIPYKDVRDAFLEKDLVSKEPIGQFQNWFEEACKTKDIFEANAMCLATATRDGVPSARVVLLKSYGKDGFKFYTNYESRKGKELLSNPRASLCFYWEPLKRSIRVEGTVEKVSEEESIEYFNSRPRESQIGASISEQSKIVPSRDYLGDKQASLTAKIGDGDIPKPGNWGGFVVVPHSIEFWQGQSNRVHDRIRFRKMNAEEDMDPNTTAGEDGWCYERLSP